MTQNQRLKQRVLNVRGGELTGFVSRRSLGVLALLALFFATATGLSGDASGQEGGTSGQEAGVAEQEGETAREAPRLPGVVEPLLWEIEGESTSYLFGTIHITDRRCLTLHPQVAAALGASDALYVEVAPQDQLQQLNAITLGEGGTKDVLSPELVERIDRQLSEIGDGLSHRTLPPFKVYAWAIVLPSLEAQMRDPDREILDLKLVRLAEERGLPIKGLEDPKTQLSGMDALTAEEQLKFLEDGLKAMEEADENGENPEATLAEYYLRGDAEELSDFFQAELESGELEGELVQKITRAMLTDRNQRMAQTIARAIREQPEQRFFFAAGAAHFVGDRSVQRYLRELGIKVRRVAAAE